MKEYAQYISINPDIRFGKPCITGTRIAVSDILSWLASDMSHQEILDDYPLIKEEIFLINQILKDLMGSANLY